MSEIGKQINCQNPELLEKHFKYKKLVDKALMIERFTNYKVLRIDKNRKGLFLHVECWSKYKKETRRIQLT